MVVVDVYIAEDANRFIETGSGAMQSRMRWFDPGSVFLPAWGAGLDVVRWSLTPE
jgi:hypothetical protein